METVPTSELWGNAKPTRFGILLWWMCLPTNDIMLKQQMSCCGGYSLVWWRSNRGENVISLFSASTRRCLYCIVLYQMVLQNSTWYYTVLQGIASTPQMLFFFFCAQTRIQPRSHQYFKILNNSAPSAQMIFFSYNLGDIILFKFSQQGSEYVVEYVEKFEYSGLPLRPHILLNILANDLRSLGWMDKK